MSTETVVAATGKQENFTFPQEIEVTIVLKIGVTDQEERDYYLNPETGTLSANATADIFDQFFSVGCETLLTVNGNTPEIVKAALKD